MRVVLIKTVAIALSLALHASAAAALVARTPGHAANEAPVAAEIDVVVDEAAPIPVAKEEEREEAAPQKVAARAVPTHTHDHPVPPSHDATPHDPSIEHPAAHVEEATAAPAVTAEAPALPTFKITIGNGGGGSSPIGAPAAAEAPVAESTVSVPAKLVARVNAVYPAEARVAEIEADVVLEIVVDRSGTVIDARVTRGAGASFDRAALAAVRAYRFSPAQRNGSAVAVRMRWPVEFRLR